LLHPPACIVLLHFVVTPSHISIAAAIDADTGVRVDGRVETLLIVALKGRIPPALPRDAIRAGAPRLPLSAPLPHITSLPRETMHCLRYLLGVLTGGSRPAPTSFEAPYPLQQALFHLHLHTARPAHPAALSFHESSLLDNKPLTLFLYQQNPPHLFGSMCSQT